MRPGPDGQLGGMDALHGLSLSAPYLLICRRGCSLKAKGRLKDNSFVFSFLSATCRTVVSPPRLGLNLRREMARLTPYTMKTTNGVYNRTGKVNLPRIEFVRVPLTRSVIDSMTLMLFDGSQASEL